MIQASQIIKKYIDFFKNKNHVQIPNSPLVPQNDPTTLFTSSGMQPLVPYLLGGQHPQGKRLVNVQNCFRAQDIDEIGDNRHTTFFRMLGNWSLGDYFKTNQIQYFFEFLTHEINGLGLSPKRLFVSVYSGEGNQRVTRNGISTILALDRHSIDIWTQLFTSVNVNAGFLDLKDLPNNVTQKEINNARIFSYGSKKNWWSRAGTPDKMPVGEPGGPDTEVFYDFGEELKIHENSKYKNSDCHPNCDCGRFMEIGNSVFMEYRKIDETKFEELPNKNVDFGGGLERLAAAINNYPDVFLTDLYKEIIKEIEINCNKSYSADAYKKPMRVIADHLKAATFLMLAGIIPSNKTQGYVLRRLLRRSAVKMYQLKGGLTPIGSFQTICDRGVLGTEETVDQTIDRQKARTIIFPIIEDEMEKFGRSLDRGLKIFENYQDSQLNELNAFNLYQSYGFPFEVLEELFKQKGKQLDRKKIDEVLEEHKNLSRTASAGMFKGGLADASEKTIMGHTATHLLHQVLRDVLGNQVHQTGSNITSERMRFDFNYDKKLSEQELEQVEHIVNEKIKENLPVHFEMMPLDKAKKLGAIGLFEEKYADKVKIYFIGDPPYSVEFCGGPHVDFTSRLKRFKIIKQENLGRGQRRIYAMVGA